YDYGRRFWTDEYRMNARLFHFPKPVASFMQGFTMGGGVGVGCHASHRVVGESSKVAMPECGIGLVPDVGGSWILGHAPGRLGEYLGVTGARMGPADAIHAGFADYFVPEAEWPDLIARLVETGDWSLIDAAAKAPPPGRLPEIEDKVRFTFSGAQLRDVVRALSREGDDFAAETLGMMRRNSPLSMACTLELVRRARAFEDIRPALEMEYRFTSRAMEHGDFLEGIRAAIIDKDRKPRWKHPSIEAVPDAEVTAMLMPLPREARVFTEETS
ncbi:MAG: enoyl-CoA hydratase/isomerase family protein, partial [Alphaproteobacteria bacterium]